MRNINMKFYLLISFCLIFAGRIFAQDTLIKNNGEQIPAKIIEITTSEIKYKKTNFLDGPTYIENKSDLRSIKYGNGRMEIFQSAATPSQPTVKMQDSISKTPLKIATDDYYQQPQEVKPSAKQPPAAAKKQDSISKAPQKIVTDDYYGKPEITGGGKATGQLSITKKTFMQNNDVITEKQFYNLLKQTNDKDIIALVEKAGRAKKRQYISFVCIFGGSACIIYPPAFIFIEPIPLLLYYKYRAVRKTSNKKAVELYNKKL